MKEKQFEEILCRYPELLEEGLTLHGRQVRVRGKIVDLLFKDRYGQKLIVELKQGPIRREHIAQLLDYEGEFLSPDDPTIRVMLVGNRVPPNLRRALDHHGFEWKELPFEHLLSFLRQKGDSEFLKYFETENVAESDPKSKEAPGKAPEESIKPAVQPQGFYLDERKYSLESRFEGKPKSARGPFRQIPCLDADSFESASAGELPRNLGPNTYMGSDVLRDTKQGIHLRRLRTAPFLTQLVHRYPEDSRGTQIGLAVEGR